VHAELWFEAGHWLLRDLGSMNGTYVEGRRITGPVRVRPGDTVSFGRTGFRLTAPAAPALPAGPAASRPTVN
jgi:pSer/pThr/pTyr-binding forkhead associated (FHA) protein